MAIISILLFFGFFIVLILFRRFILVHIIPRIFNLGFLLIGFFLVGVTFSLLYFGLDYLVNNKVFDAKFYSVDFPHTTLNYLYFSFISQLTIGYGDISPLHPIGKSLSMIQGVIGAIFMGGLIASLLEFSKSSLNYMYISEVKFFHCDAASNHGSEIFNMDLTLFKTKNSLFDNFKVFLIAKHENNKQITLLAGSSEFFNEREEISIDIAQENKYPRLVDNSGTLSYETFNVFPQNQITIGQSMAGPPTLFAFEELYIKYQYSFESKLYIKEVRIENKDMISNLISMLGRSSTSSQKVDRH